jgi:hypothetical protein
MLLATYCKMICKFDNFFEMFFETSQQNALKITFLILKQNIHQLLKFQKMASLALAIHFMPL